MALFCYEENIALTPYSALASGRFSQEPGEDSKRLQQDSYAKVTSPMVGATKFHHIEGAAKAVELELTEDEIHDLEEPYVSHALAGVMAQNKPESAPHQIRWGFFGNEL